MLIQSLGGKLSGTKQFHKSVETFRSFQNGGLIRCSDFPNRTFSNSLFFIFFSESGAEFL